MFYKINSESETKTYYKDGNFKEEIITVGIDQTVNIHDHMSSLYMYKYTFEENNGDYYLAMVEKVK